MEVVEKYQKKDCWGKRRTFSRTVWKEVPDEQWTAPALGRYIAVFWLILIAPFIALLSGVNAATGWF